MSHFFSFELLPAAFSVLGATCLFVIGGAIAYFIIRDIFRFGRQEIHASWAIVIIALFTTVGYAAVGYGGLLVAPVFGSAYAFGRRCGRKDAEKMARRKCEPSV